MSHDTDQSIKELQADIARLRAALTPFANIAERFQPTGRKLADKRHSQAILWSACDRKYEITAADCINAAEALRDLAGQQSHPERTEADTSSLSAL